MLARFFVLTYALTWTLFIAVAVAIPARTGLGGALVLLGAAVGAVPGRRGIGWRGFALSVALAWTYYRSGGSLLLTMLMHSAINNTKEIVPSGVNPPPGVFSLHASLVSWLTLVILWAAAAYFLRRTPSRNPLGWPAHKETRDGDRTPDIGS
jgi:hypothetical protein